MKEQLKQKRKHRIYVYSMLAITTLLLTTLTNKTNNTEEKNIVTNRDNISGGTQPFPFLKEEGLVYNDLEKYSIDNVKAKYIFENIDKLPIAQQRLLANNKDTTAYVHGYLTGKRVEYSEGESVELGRRYPYYIQWDRRWAYDPLGSDDVAIGGCGPVVVAMLLAGELGDKSITPRVIADIENKSGHYTPYGTAWSFFKYIADRYSMNYEEVSLSQSAIDKVLERGDSLITSVEPGRFTTVGHIVLIVGKDDNGNYIINDPNSLGRSLKTWTYDELKTEIKSMWSIYK